MSAPPPYTQQPYPQSYGYPQPQQNYGYPQPQSGYPQPQPQGFPQPQPLSGNPQEQLQVVVVERDNSSSNKNVVIVLLGAVIVLLGAVIVLPSAVIVLPSAVIVQTTTRTTPRTATSSIYELSSPYEQTQALGTKAAATLKSTATESLAKIFSAANGQSENYDIVSYATSKIEAVKKDGLAAIDSAVATAKTAYEVAAADRTVAGANMEVNVKANAVTAIDAALSAAVIAINAVTDSAISAIHPIDLWSNNSTAYTITNKSVVMFMFVLLITTKMFSSPGTFTVWYVME